MQLRSMTTSINSLECASIYHIIGPSIWIGFPCQHLRYRKCCWCLTMVVDMYVQGLAKHARIGPRLGVVRPPPQINHHPTNAYRWPPLDHRPLYTSYPSNGNAPYQPRPPTTLMYHGGDQQKFITQRKVCMMNHYTLLLGGDILIGWRMRGLSNHYHLLQNQHKVMVYYHKHNWNTCTTMLCVQKIKP